jgi:C1A family cysteine protease
LTVAAPIINNNGAKGRARMGALLNSWRPQLPDHRDRVFAPSGAVLRPVVEPLGKARGVRIHDQGMTSSCTGHAGTTAVEISLSLSGDTNQLSRLFPYYRAREMIGEAQFDNGAYCRDIFKSFVKFGCPHESKWRFTTPNITKAPSATSVAEAAKLRDTLFAGVVYESCRSLEQIVGAINDGFAVMFGFAAYESIYGLSKTNAVLPLPGPNDRPLGGHAVVADGYDMAERFLWIENSWGTSWGMGGRFKMPFNWITDQRRLADDFWIIRKP